MYVKNLMRLLVCVSCCDPKGSDSHESDKTNQDGCSFFGAPVTGFCGCDPNA